MTSEVHVKISECLHLGMQLHKGRFLAEAEMLYRRVLDVAPDTLDALHYLALICHQQKRFDEAAQLIGRVIAIAPGNADAHNNLGNVYEGKGDQAQAEFFFRKAIELNPDHAPAHNNLGVILAEQGRLMEAVTVYRKAVQLAPEVAEFHYNLGNALRRNEDLGAAVDAYTAATNLDPNHFQAWQGLARSLRLAGRREEAVAVFDNLLRLNPDNPVFSYLRAACAGEEAPERAPDDYVKQIFDEAADYFEQHLDALEYRAPSLLTEALACAIPAAQGSLHLLDAGCGTGLCGPMLRPYAGKLVGVDLSEGMLRKAAERHIYHDLYKAELTRFMQDQPDAYDVIVSADTLCYFGELQKVFQAAAQALKPGGLLAFTLEDSGEEAWYRLNSCGRYSHSRGYVEATLGAAGFSLKRFASATLRNEGKEPVSGHVVVAGKAP